MGKLTLSVDADVVASAKDFAARHGTSVSSLVSRFLKSLDQAKEDDYFKRLHAELKHDGYQAPSVDEADLRKRHIQRKYR